MEMSVGKRVTVSRKSTRSCSRRSHIRISGFLVEDWLYEADHRNVYPLIRMCERCCMTGVDFRLTVTFPRRSFPC